MKHEIGVMNRVTNRANSRMKAEPPKAKDVMILGIGAEIDATTNVAIVEMTSVIDAMNRVINATNLVINAMNLAISATNHVINVTNHVINATNHVNNVTNLAINEAAEEIVTMTETTDAIAIVIAEEEMNRIPIVIVIGKEHMT
ncbi:MAG: hypothetical protein NTX15_10075 [Candidatus Kapabacteria bacterium]|nr:hypothetical protein [Candidatus Kapabacteria bacterium]